MAGGKCARCGFEWHSGPRNLARHACQDFRPKSMAGAGTKGMPIEQWIEETPGMKKLLEEFKIHRENAEEESIERCCAISLRGWAEVHQVVVKP